jgi:hypothetical protein
MSTYVSKRTVQWTKLSEENRDLVNTAIKAAISAMVAEKRSFRFGGQTWSVSGERPSAYVVFSRQKPGTKANVLAIHASNVDAHPDQVGMFWAHISNMEEKGNLGVWSAEGECIQERWESLREAEASIKDIPF